MPHIPIGVLNVTSQFDGYESDTLFNSMQEGGQGVFSLMVDLKNVVDLGRPGQSAQQSGTTSNPIDATSGTVGRRVLVGQELRIELSERSVSPEAGDLTVVWSNGFVGPQYHVQPEDLGTTLSATATFAGQDMRPLEVTIECGPVVLAPAPTFDPQFVAIVGSKEPGESDVPPNGITEFAPVHLFVDHAAFSTPVDSLDVTWLIDGVEVYSQEGIVARTLTSSLELELLERDEAARSAVPQEETQPKIPGFLAEVLFGNAKADTVGGVTVVDFTSDSSAEPPAPSELAAFLEFASANVGSGLPLESELDALVDLAAPSSTNSDTAEHNFPAESAASEVDSNSAGGSSAEGVFAETKVEEGGVEGPRSVTQPFFTAQFTPPQSSHGSVLSVEITAHVSGADSLTKRINAGWIGQGKAFELRDNVSISVSDPRVGETAWVKAKARHFAPVADTLSYQWTLNGKIIEGATKPKLKVTKDMRGRELAVLVEASGERAMCWRCARVFGRATRGQRQGRHWRHLANRESGIRFHLA